MYLRKLKANIMTTQVYSHDIELGKLGGAFSSAPSDSYRYNKQTKTAGLAHRVLLYRALLCAVGLFFVLLFASCQDGQFPPVGTYNFHCKISEIDHLLSGTYELLGDSTILLTFFDEDGKATGDEVALRFSQCASDSFYIEPVGGSPMHKKKYVKME